MTNMVKKCLNCKYCTFSVKDKEFHCKPCPKCTYIVTIDNVCRIWRDKNG